MSDRVIRDVLLSDVESIRQIYREFVTDSVVSFEMFVPTVEEFQVRIGKANERYPWIVMLAGDVVCGHAYASPFRSREAYQFTVETTVYVHHTFHRQGVGGELMERLLSRLRGLGYHAAIAGVTLPNDGSVALHERPGYRKVGVFPKIGRKFDEWHDVGFWCVNFESGD